MALSDLQLSSILDQAIKKALIVENFQYGHNLFQSPVQIDEIFSMLDTIIKSVIDAIDDVIPDINLAPYKEGMVDSSRANLCWVELADNYYGLILNTHKGIKYREFSSDDLQNLILNGQSSSWYLISKIQNISYLLSSNSKNNTINVDFFKSLIIDIIERFFYDHEHSKEFHPGGRININNIDKVFSNVQIQNSSSVIPAPITPTDHKGDATWSQSIIKTNKHEICWQSASDFTLTEIKSENALDIIMSKYLNERSDVGVFLESTFKKRKENTQLPNVFCYLSKSNLDVSYINLNYEVSSQLTGYFVVHFTNGEEKNIYPNMQPIVIEKGKNEISFMVIFKINNDIINKVESVDASNVRLICSCTGISNNTES